MQGGRWERRAGAALGGGGGGEGSDMTSGSGLKGRGHQMEKGDFQEEGLLDAKGSRRLMWGVGSHSEKVAQCFPKLEFPRG